MIIQDGAGGRLSWVLMMKEVMSYTDLFLDSLREPLCGLLPLAKPQMARSRGDRAIAHGNLSSSMRDNYSEFGVSEVSTNDNSRADALESLSFL